MLQIGTVERRLPSHLPRGRDFAGNAMESCGSVRIGDMEMHSHRLPCGALGMRAGLPLGDGPSLVLLTEGSAKLSRSGKHITLSEGEWTLAQGHLVVTAEQRAGLLVVRLGKDFNLQSAEQLRSFMLCRYDEACGAAQMVYSHAVGMVEIESKVSLGAGQELAAITAHLVRLALTEASAVRPLIGMRDTLRVRIRNYVERNLRDPNLSIDGIAARFKCSKRNLHKVFQEEGDTLNRLLWSTRLDRCRVDLEDPMLRHRSITEIAFGWGFNSSAHFSRAFRARFGVTPRDIRA